VIEKLRVFPHQPVTSIHGDDTVEKELHVCFIDNLRGEGKVGRGGSEREEKGKGEG
jgi:hypothetical protein